MPVLDCKTWQFLASAQRWNETWSTTLHFFFMECLIQLVLYILASKPRHFPPKKNVFFKPIMKTIEITKKGVEHHHCSVFTCYPFRLQLKGLETTTGRSSILRANVAAAGELASVGGHWQVKSSEYPKQPIGKRKNKGKAVVWMGIFFLTHQIRRVGCWKIL